MNQDQAEVILKRLAPLAMLTLETAVENLAQIVQGTKRLAVFQLPHNRGFVYEVRLRDAGTMMPDEGSADELKAMFIQVKDEVSHERAKGIIHAMGFDGLAQLLQHPKVFPAAKQMCELALNPPAWEVDPDLIDDLA